MASNSGVGSAVNPDLLKALTGDVANRLLIIDCEGYDAALVDPERIPGLKQATLLVECHDFVDRSITNTLTHRLPPTLYLELISEGARDPNRSPLLKPVGWPYVSSDRRRCIGYSQRQSSTIPNVYFVTFHFVFQLR
jgi:hypothetical protein